jgi:tripartite-type tricarboxylate transporter receptor subunit TctC
VQALVAGQVDLIISNLSTALANARNGRVKVIAVTHDARYEGLPEVPSVKEALPGYSMPAGWYGFFGPAGMPRAVVNRLNGEIARALNAPDMKPKISAATFSILGGSPEDLAALVHTGLDVYGRLTRAAHIQAQ